MRLMRGIFRLLSLVIVLLAFLVLARYVWAKYLTGKEDISLQKAVEQTKKDLISGGEYLNEQVEKVLGEQTGKKQLDAYIKEDLPEEVRKQLEQSEVVREVQKEVNTVINNATEKIKELPQSEVEKLKKDLRQEICKDLLEEKKE